MAKQKAKTRPKLPPPNAHHAAHTDMTACAQTPKIRPAKRVQGFRKVVQPHFGSRIQVAALPHRLGENGLEILLITSRETQRWVIPKGWLIKGRSQWGAAAREALEEAGVKGKIGRKTIGSYDYVKRGQGGQQWPCDVHVFPLEVQTERAGWKERSERERLWFGVDEAAAAVDEPGLGGLILSFALCWTLSVLP